MAVVDADAATKAILAQLPEGTLCGSEAVWVSNGCEVNGDKLTVTNASGICSVTAAKAVTDNYNATTSAPKTVTLRKANQTINFGEPNFSPPKKFGDDPFTVSATAPSGLGVSFEATGTCTILGNTVRITGAGNCTITATQPGNANYNTATAVSRTFAIDKANQTITFTAPTGKTFGNLDFDLGATASSGLLVSYSSSTQGVCTLDSLTNQLHIVSAGLSPRP